MKLTVMAHHSKKRVHLIIFGFYIFFIQINLFNFIFEYNYDSNEYNIKPMDIDDIFGDLDILRPCISDILKIGDYFTIKWNYKGSIERVTIVLYNNFDFIDSIATSTINDGEYVWLVGQYNDDNDYNIGIWDYHDKNSFDLSDQFRIATDYENSLEKNMLKIIIITIIIGLAIASIAVLLIKFRNNIH